MRGHDPMPRIFRYPAALTPLAIRQCTFTVQPPSRTFQFSASLLEAGTITLPIGPNHSIGLGKGEDKWIDLDEPHVARLNAMQVSEAMAWVMYHPDSGLKSFMGAVRPAAS